MLWGASTFPRIVGIKTIFMMLLSSCLILSFSQHLFWAHAVEAVVENMVSKQQQSHWKLGIARQVSPPQHFGKLHSSHSGNTTEKCRQYIIYKTWILECAFLKNTV